MNRILLFTVLILLVSCATKTKQLEIVSNYELGFELSAESEQSVYMKPIADFCLYKGESLSDVQYLIPDREYKYIPYKFNINTLFAWMNKVNDCEEEMIPITIEEFSSKLLSFDRFRYNGYITEIQLKASTSCNLKVFSTETKGSGSVENKDVIGELEKVALVSASVIGAFYQAVNGIYDDISIKCNL